MAQQTLLGAKGKYYIEPSTPIGYGRLTVLFAGKSSAGPDVCVKLFRDKIETAKGEVDFEHEVRVMQMLAHPNILPLLDYGSSPELDDRPFLVMPFCERGNLRSLLSGRNFAPLDTAMKYLRDVAVAIDYAHSGGVIHGDIKPENILLTDDDRAVLADFGAARYRYQAHRERYSSETTALSAQGTPMYASPEQLTARVQSHLRSDLYSFAMVAYELLTGRLPVADESPYELMRKRIDGELLDPLDANPNLPRAAGDALMWGLSIDPKVRPGTAGELIAALNGAFGSSQQSIAASARNNVFVVHGRNLAFLHEVLYFLGKVGVRPVALLDEVNRGRTIIEKLEAYGDVGAAVALFTPDDVVLATGAATTGRARQNVVFEFGYFCGRLGRSRVIAMCAPGVEIPSDLDGIVYIPIDGTSSWKVALLRELRTSGVAAADFDSI